MMKILSSKASFVLDFVREEGGDMAL